MRRCLLVAVLLSTATLPGCITFYGDPVVEVEVLVTTDMGTRVLEHANITVPEGASVLDALRETATVETRYGGGFVHAIDGRESLYPDERVDWFYYVDGRLADVGAATNELEDGQTVVWDHRSWNRTMTVEHLLTGLDAWPGNATAPEPTPDAWRAYAADEAVQGQLFARIDDRNLTLMDTDGDPARTLTPPWFIAHVADGPTRAPELIVEASGPEGAQLASRLATIPPVGLGVAITPNATLEVPS